MAKQNDTDRMLDELVKGKNPEEMLGEERSPQAADQASRGTGTRR